MATEPEVEGSVCLKLRKLGYVDRIDIESGHKNSS